MKMCAYPNCKRRAASRGKKSHGELARFKWCGPHRQGRFKHERLKLLKLN